MPKPTQDKKSHLQDEPIQKLKPRTRKDPKDAGKKRNNTKESIGKYKQRIWLSAVMKSIAASNDAAAVAAAEKVLHPDRCDKGKQNKTNLLPAYRRQLSQHESFADYEEEEWQSIISEYLTLEEADDDDESVSSISYLVYYLSCRNEDITPFSVDSMEYQDSIDV